MAYKKSPTRKKRYPFKRILKRRIRRIVFMVVAGLIASGVNYYNKNANSTTDDLAYKQSTKIDKSTYYDPNSIPYTNPKTLNKLYKARNNTKAKFWVTVQGKVIKVLKDDLVGSHHQKFLTKIDDDFTLLISHNIDLAPRAPIAKGKAVRVSGLYEWNNRGGVIHWTHHDPKGRKKGGWIKVNGKKYQ